MNSFLQNQTSTFELHCSWSLLHHPHPRRNDTLGTKLASEKVLKKKKKNKNKHNDSTHKNNNIRKIQKF